MSFKHPYCCIVILKEYPLLMPSFANTPHARKQAEVQEHQRRIDAKEQMAKVLSRQQVTERNLVHHLMTNQQSN